MLARKGIFSRPSMAQSHESARWQRQKACIARLSAHIIPRRKNACSQGHFFEAVNGAVARKCDMATPKGLHRKTFCAYYTTGHVFLQYKT